MNSVEPLGPRGPVSSYSPTDEALSSAEEVHLVSQLLDVIRERVFELSPNLPSSTLQPAAPLPPMAVRSYEAAAGSGQREAARAVPETGRSGQQEAARPAQPPLGQEAARLALAAAEAHHEAARAAYEAAWSSQHTAAIQARQQWANLNGGVVRPAVGSLGMPGVRLQGWQGFPGVSGQQGQGYTGGGVTWNPNAGSRFPIAGMTYAQAQAFAAARNASPTGAVHWVAPSGGMPGYARPLTTGSPAGFAGSPGGRGGSMPGYAAGGGVSRVGGPTGTLGAGGVPSSQAGEGVSANAQPLKVSWDGLKKKGRIDA